MKPSQVKVLVTGGAGFLGSHLVDALLAQGHTVSVLDNFSSGKQDNLVSHPALHVIEGDVRDVAILQRAVQQMDVVVHLAAIASVQQSVSDPVMTHAVNFGGTLNVLEAARLYGVRRVLFASSAAVYGDTPELPTKEDVVLNPLTPYAADKLASENYLDFYRRMHGLETACFRFFNIFGERQDPASPYSGVISIFVSKILQGKPLTIFGDGEQTRDFIYVKDVISILMQAITVEQLHCAPVNIGHGKSISLNALLKMMLAIANKTVPVIHEDARSGDIRHSMADITRLIKYYKKEETSMSDGLARLFASLVAN